MSGASVLIVLAAVMFLAIVFVNWYEKRKLRRFYEGNEYRTTAEVIARRQVSSVSGLDCWELSVRYRDMDDREETVRLTTCDPEAARRSVVEIALLQRGTLVPEKMRERFERMNAREREKMTAEECRALLHELLDEEEKSASWERRLRGTLAILPKRVRLWEERYETYEACFLRKQRRRTAAKYLAGGLAAVLGLGVFFWWYAGQ